MHPSTPRWLPVCCSLFLGCGSEGAEESTNAATTESSPSSPTAAPTTPSTTSELPNSGTPEPEPVGGAGEGSGPMDPSSEPPTTTAGSGGEQSGVAGSPVEGSGGTATGGTGAGSVPEPSTPGGAGGASSGAAGAPAQSDGDTYATNVGIEVHEEVATVLVVEWEQILEADEVWLEFEFEDGDVSTSRAKPGSLGTHQDVVLGVPAETDVRVRVVSSAGGGRHVSQDYSGTTGSLPQGLPQPEILAYEPTQSSPERWMVGSVEDSGGNLPSDYLFDTFWVFVMDRQGRIVWYYADPASNATMSFQRLARDGEYLWIEKRPFGFGGYRGVLKMTLDWEYFEEIEVEGLADCIDVTPDGSVLYDANDVLRERTRDGEDIGIWSCADHFGADFLCYTNTINYNPADDSVLMSYPEENTVIQVDRSSGEVIGQYGDAEGSWSFAAPLETPPDAWGFGFQHFPNITPDGTLVVSSHMPGYTDFEQAPTPNQHAFIEFELDRENQQLVELWRYTEGPEWARSRGMVIKLENGNYLGNYGTGGVIREVTPTKETVFHVKFDIEEEGEDDYNKLLGNIFYLDDLYRLNGGPSGQEPQ